MTLIPLLGHVSQETAYTQPDYPYGRTLRCQRRVWVETAAKGSKKGQMRFVYQTSNPKNGGWNTPTNGQYSDYILLVHNTENDHVDPVHLSISTWGDAISRFNQFHADFYQQLNDENRKAVDHVGFCCAALKNTEKGLFVNAVEAHQGDRIEVDDRWFYDKKLGIVQDVFAHKVGDGDSATIPVVSAQEWHPKKGFLFNLHSRISEEMEAKARAIVEWKPADFPKELWCRTVLYGWRGFAMPDGKPVNDLAIAWKNENDKTKKEELRTQIWNAAEACWESQSINFDETPKTFPETGATPLPIEDEPPKWAIELLIFINMRLRFKVLWQDEGNVRQFVSDLRKQCNDLMKAGTMPPTDPDLILHGSEAIANTLRGVNLGPKETLFYPQFPVHIFFYEDEANGGCLPDPESFCRDCGFGEFEDDASYPVERAFLDYGFNDALVIAAYLKLHHPQLSNTVDKALKGCLPAEQELNGCIYWNLVTPFPKELQDYLDKRLIGYKDCWLVNAPRPIPGDLLFQGDFRHGIFYAYGVASNFFQAWKELDAWRVKPITNREIIEDLERRSQKYSRTLSEMTSKLSKERLRNWVIERASQYGMPFVDRPEPGYLDLVEAVNNGKNTIPDLIAHFYGKETYDYTEYATSPEEIINRRVQIDLIGGCPAYIYDGDKIILKPEEEDLKKIADILPEATEAIAPIDEFDIDIEEEESSEELDASLVAAWDSADDSEEGEVEAVEVDEAIAQYLNVVAMAADNTHALTAKKAEQCLDYCLDNGIAGFKEWLLQQDIKPAVKTAVENWEEKPVDPFEVEVVDTPSAPKSLKTSKTKSKTGGGKSKGGQRKAATEEGDRSKAAEVAKTSPKSAKSAAKEVGSTSETKTQPKTNAKVKSESEAKDEGASEPKAPDVYWQIAKTPSQKDVVELLGLLADLEEYDLIERLFVPLSKDGSNPKIKPEPTGTPTRKVRGLSTEEQIKINKEYYEKYKAIVDVITSLGITAASKHFTAQGHKMNAPTAWTIKRAWNDYLHGSKKIMEWFNKGYISWGNIYSERGTVENVEQALIEKRLKPKGLIPF